MIRRLGHGAVSLALCAVLVVSTTGCTPAEQATGGQIENKVLADLSAGDGLPQIEGDVQTILKATSPTAAVVIDAIDTALELLVLAGDIPPGLVPTVSSYRQTLAVAKAENAAKSASAPAAPSASASSATSTTPAAAPKAGAK